MLNVSVLMWVSLYLYAKKCMHVQYIDSCKGVTHKSQQTHRDCQPESRALAGGNESQLFAKGESTA